MPPVIDPNYSEETDELCSFACTAVVKEEPLLADDRLSTFSFLKRVTARGIRFSTNCWVRRFKLPHDINPLSVQVLNKAENYRFKNIQRAYWLRETESIKRTYTVSQSSCIRSLNPVLDEDGLLHVGGRDQNAWFSFNSHYLVVLLTKHPLVKFLIRSEHLRLLHGGSPLISASLPHQFYIVS